MSSRASETPPSSKHLLQRRLVVDRKQCVYSDLPKRSQWRSDGSTLSKKQSPSAQGLTTSRSQDKVIERTDSSGSSVVTSSIGDTPVAPPYRRQSIHAVSRRDSPLRRGAKKLLYNPSFFLFRYKDVM